MREQDLKHNTRKGFALLITVLVVGIVLAIGLSILTITLKEYLLSGIARESAIALNAADAGMECALYWDRSASPDGGKFDPGTTGSSITCMGKTIPVPAYDASSPVNNFSLNEAGAVGITWGTPVVCAKVSVTKYYNASAPVPMGLDSNGNPLPPCPAGIVCTRTESRGYNKACSDITTPRTVERGLRERH